MTDLLPYRWRTPIAAALHNRAIRGVLAAPPIVPADDGVVLFSMMGTKVLLPYIVAVKSLWQQVRRGRVVILDDGTLTGGDKALLDHHCGKPEIIAIASVDTGAFPVGGTWERFLTILDHRSGEYWIQLDSDTVTLGPVPEVIAAIEANRSFAFLGGTDGEVGALPLAEFARRLYPQGPEEGHVQTRFESRLAEAGGDWRYLRGCSGFAGFAAGGEGRARAAHFLELLSSLVGPDDVTIWGTEQIASNFHLANEPDPVILPSSRYVNYWGEPWHDDTGFLHFVGSFRYARGAYRRASLAAIAQMGADGLRNTGPRSPSDNRTTRIRAGGNSFGSA
ncbi:hypothetical protein B2G71_00780 [Novosphingobium sp. PC22D]|uniref:hypothetical protein n=1 Tax=Novosphingobium sp. PC22D TaxID=1962403 RepID=UPI000BEF8D11|nr:hypothetical protein [Novosphingobium sp. PC22D]PEQ14179.1 hypothetical protein B2G71_00780 [Novosphingobium sp. PC22D]